MSESGVRKESGELKIPRQVMVAACTAIVILLLGIAGLKGAQSVLKVVLDKPPAPLPGGPGSLANLPREFGNPVRYEAKEQDKTLSPEIVAVLGTQDYLLRDYVDTTKKPGEVGSLLSLNLNYYATGSATPHVPDICWTGSGMVQQGNSFFTIKDVRHKDGSVSDLRMRMLSFAEQPQTPSDFPAGALGNNERSVNVAYIFNVNGQYVANTAEVTKHFWDLHSKWAYHSKIEVRVSSLCTPEEAKAVVEDFIRTSLADIENMLPDAESLAASDNAGKTKVSR